MKASEKQQTLPSAFGLEQGLNFPCEGARLLSPVPDPERPSSLGKERWHREDAAQTNLRKSPYLPIVYPANLPSHSTTLRSPHPFSFAYHLSIIYCLLLKWYGKIFHFVSVRPVRIQNKPFLPVTLSFVSFICRPQLLNLRGKDFPFLQQGYFEK